MEPRPRSSPDEHVPIAWPAVRSIQAPHRPPLDESFSDILTRRRSIRQLVPCPLSQLTAAIGFATRSRFAREARPPRYRRPSPSAGGLHPLHAIICTARGKPRAFLCDPDANRLTQLNVAEPELIKSLRDAHKTMLPDAAGHCVVLVGDAGLIDAHYENGEALFWREAGSLAQTLLLTFEAYGLAACLLGISGAELVPALAMKGQIVAAGAMVVGARSQ